MQARACVPLSGLREGISRQHKQSLGRRSLQEKYSMSGETTRQLSWSLLRICNPNFEPGAAPERNDV